MSSFPEASEKARRKSTVTFAESDKKDKKDKKEKKVKKEKKEKKEKEKKHSKGKATGATSASGLSDAEEFAATYSLKEPLGTGSYSEVRKAIRRSDKAVVAIKCIKKSKLAPEDLDAILREIDILRRIQHPHIIEFYANYITDKMIYIVMEYVPGGELFNRIVEKEFYNENDAQKVVATVAASLKYCHKRGVVHRDLKPENILLTSPDDDSNIKIADFGFAKQVNKRTSMQHALTTTLGTPGYIAPEVLSQENYGPPVDMWALGVIMYILLCGYPPFFDEDQDRLFKTIIKGDFKFDPDYWKDISESAKDLIRGLLCVDPEQRHTAEDVLNHPWITEEHDKDITPALSKLRVFKNKGRWKLIYNVINATGNFSKVVDAAG